LLEPNVIPDHEPTLRVGIFLPADETKSIRLDLPERPVYRLLSDQGESYTLAARTKVEFIYCEKLIGLMLNDEAQKKRRQWRLAPVDGDSMTNKSGIRVKNVIAGRGFHWRKFIDVYLPGILEIGMFNNNLVLINELPIEQYLMCVATSEMGADCPPALIESQTIVARSWMLANVEMKHRACDMDVCNDDCCQRYQGTTFLSEQSVAGAQQTAGQVLIYANKICDTRYSKSCGGVTEDFQSVFGDPAVPYIYSVVDAPEGFQSPVLPLTDEGRVRRWIEATPETFCSTRIVPAGELRKYLGTVDENGEYFRWTFRYPQKQITALFNLKLNLNAQAVKHIQPLKRGRSGRLIEVRIVYLDDQGKERAITVQNQYTIRETFHELFLYSSAFVIDELTESGQVPTMFVLKGAGWGHGAGYCQIGALGMALRGYSTEAILKHYFPTAVLQKIY